jgi:hypothetical protein
MKTLKILSAMLLGLSGLGSAQAADVPANLIVSAGGVRMGMGVALRARSSVLRQPTDHA